MTRSALVRHLVSGPMAVAGSSSRDSSEPAKCTSPAKAIRTGLVALVGVGGLEGLVGRTEGLGLVVSSDCAD